MKARTGVPLSLKASDPTRRRIGVETFTLFGKGMPVFGKNHSNCECRTLAGLSGFLSVSGHFLQRMWGKEGAALCGATVQFSSDPVTMQPGSMARCCAARYHRIRRRLEQRRGDRAGRPQSHSEGEGN